MARHTHLADCEQSAIAPVLLGAIAKTGAPMVPGEFSQQVTIQVTFQ
ncbi:hypothetical protein WJ977_03035 [Achromobacter xylosoxidans]